MEFVAVKPNQQKWPCLVEPDVFICEPKLANSVKTGTTNTTRFQNCQLLYKGFASSVKSLS